MTEDLDRLDVLAARQIDAALRFYADQMPAYAAAAGLDQEEFAAVMVDVEVVRKFKGDHVLVAVRERDELRAAEITRERLGDAIAQTDTDHSWLPEGLDVEDATDWLWTALHREDGA